MAILLPRTFYTTTTMTSPKLLLMLLAALPSISTALDIQLTSWECDETLQVYATSFDMNCDSSTRCTFGELASFFGTIQYSGVENTGIQNNLAYLSADLTFTTLHYDLFDYFEFDLCYDGVIEEIEGDGSDTSNNNACPGDSEYGFSVAYTLPGATETSWLATGFTGYGDLYMYADQSQDALIGYCQFELKPMVTPDSAKSFNMPSAKATGITALVLVGLLVLTLLYCTCCRRRRRGGDSDDATSFIRMQEGDNQSSAMSTRPGTLA